MIFDRFVASAGSGIPVTERRKNCQVNRPAQVRSTPNALGSAYGSSPMTARNADARSTARPSSTACYDNNGNVVSSKDGRNNTTSFAVDPLNRLTSETQLISATANIVTKCRV